MTIGYIKHCNSRHVPVIISQAISRVLTAHRRKLWLSVVIVFTSEEKLITQEHCELPTSHSTKSHLQATASPETA